LFLLACNEKDTETTELSEISESTDINQRRPNDFVLTATGQALSYDKGGEVLKGLVSGDAFFSQDADYQKGVPISYTDDNDGTISDNATGLTWG